MKFSLFAAGIGVSLLTTQVAEAAEVKAFVTTAMRPPYETLIPQFERASGHKLVPHVDLPPALVRKIDAGESYDVVLLSYDIEPLIKQGKVVADSRTVFGRIGVGVAARPGAPKPDFSTVEAFKRSLLAAKGIATSGDGSSGRYFVSLIERLGIAEQIKPKIRSAAAADAFAKMLASGEVDFVVSGLPPLIGTPGIEWLGLLPDEINTWLLFSGGISVNAKEAQAGRDLLKFLTTPASLAVFKANGMDPP